MNWYKRAKKLLEFDFGDEQHTLWRELIKEEKDRCNVDFDFENDDWDEEPRDIRLGVKEDVFNEDEYRVRAQLWSAGGDWESPVAYFRCQLFLKDRALHKFVYIPMPNEGNINLHKTEKGYCAGSSDDFERRTDEDDKKLWKALTRHAKEVAKKVEEHGTYSDGENKEYVRDLTDLF